jgi:hypothetical protein
LDTSIDSKGRKQPRQRAAKPGQQEIPVEARRAEFAAMEGAGEPTVAPPTDSLGDQKRQKSKTEIDAENAEKVAWSICARIGAAIDLFESDSEHARRVIELLRTKYLYNFAELARALIGLQSEGAKEPPDVRVATDILRHFADRAEAGEIDPHELGKIAEAFSMAELAEALRRSPNSPAVDAELDVRTFGKGKLRR